MPSPTNLIDEARAAASASDRSTTQLASDAASGGLDDGSNDSSPAIEAMDRQMQDAKSQQTAVTPLAAQAIDQFEAALPGVEATVAKPDGQQSQSRSQQSSQGDQQSQSQARQLAQQTAGLSQSEASDLLSGDRQRVDVSDGRGAGLGAPPAPADGLDDPALDLGFEREGVGLRRTVAPSTPIESNPSTPAQQDIGDSIVPESVEGAVEDLSQGLRSLGEGAGGAAGDVVGGAIEAPVDLAGFDSVGDALDSAAEKAGRGAGSLLSTPADVAGAGIEVAETGGAVAGEVAEGDVSGAVNTAKTASDQATVLAQQAATSAKRNPIETGGSLLAGFGVSAGVSRAARAASLPKGLPDVDSSLRAFRKDTRGQQQLASSQQSRSQPDSQSTGGGASSTTSDELLSGSPRDQISADIADRAQTQRRQAGGRAEPSGSDADATVGRGPPGESGTGGVGSLLRESDIPTQRRRDAAVDNALDRSQTAQRPQVRLDSGVSQAALGTTAAGVDAQSQGDAGLSQAAQSSTLDAGGFGPTVGNADSGQLTGPETTARPRAEMRPTDRTDSGPTDRTDTAPQTDSPQRPGATTRTSPTNTAGGNDPTATTPPGPGGTRPPGSRGSRPRPRISDRDTDPPDDERRRDERLDEEVFSSGIQGVEDILQDLGGTKND